MTAVLSMGGAHGAASDIVYQLIHWLAGSRSDAGRFRTARRI